MTSHRVFCAGAAVVMLTLIACSAGDLTLPGPGQSGPDQPAALKVLSGDGQRAEAGTILDDPLTVQVLGPRVEISFGWSILLYAVLAAIMHGLRPLFIRGRWEVHCIMSGLCTSAILLSQYLMIAIRRGSLVFTREAWWQIGGPGVRQAQENRDGIGWDRELGHRN